MFVSCGALSTSFLAERRAWLSPLVYGCVNDASRLTLHPSEETACEEKDSAAAMCLPAGQLLKHTSVSRGFVTAASMRDDMCGFRLVGFASRCGPALSLGRSQLQ